MSILPNRMLSTLGWHTAGGESGLGGDCMTLAVSPDGALLATGIPFASTLRFWRVGQLAGEAQQEVEMLSGGGKQKNTSNKSGKARATSKSMDAQRYEFLSGLMSLPRQTDSDDDNDASEADSDDSDWLHLYIFLIPTLYFMLPACC